jgi:hypothetical protein
MQSKWGLPCDFQVRGAEQMKTAWTEQQDHREADVSPAIDDESSHQHVRHGSNEIVSDTPP